MTEDAGVLFVLIVVEGEVGGRLGGGWRFWGYGGGGV